MSKAIMFSIHPQWCLEIIGGGKKMEVRRKRPKIEPPFKCYIYQTKKGQNPCQHSGVIGEFICRGITKFDVPYPAFQDELDSNILKLSRLTYWQLHRYAYHDPLYGFHISELKIYSRPKPVADFGLKRPPQSWCYVVEE